MTMIDQTTCTACPDWCDGPHEEDEPDHFRYVRELVGPERFSVHLRCPRNRGNLATVIEFAYTTETPSGDKYGEHVPMTAPLARSLAAALLDAADRAERN